MKREIFKSTKISCYEILCHGWLMFFNTFLRFAKDMNSRKGKVLCLAEPVTTMRRKILFSLSGLKQGDFVY